MQGPRQRLAQPHSPAGATPQPDASSFRFGSVEFGCRRSLICALVIVGSFMINPPPDAP